MLEWLLWLALPFALVVALLLPPLDLVFEGRIDANGASQRARLHWLGMRIPLRPSQRSAPRARAKPGVDPLAMWRTDGFPHAVRRLLTRMRRAVRVRALRLRAAFGFDDPSATGMAMAYLAPLSVLAVPPRADVRIEPDFARERFEGELAARVRVWPLLAAGAFLLFALTPATLRALRAGRRA